MQTDQGWVRRGKQSTHCRQRALSLTILPGVEPDAAERERLHERLLHVGGLCVVEKGERERGGGRWRSALRCVAGNGGVAASGSGGAAGARVASVAVVAAAAAAFPSFAPAPRPISSRTPTRGSSRMPFSMMSSSSILGWDGGRPLRACCCGAASATALRAKPRGCWRLLLLTLGRAANAAKRPDKAAARCLVFRPACRALGPEQASLCCIFVSRCDLMAFFAANACGIWRVSACLQCLRTYIYFQGFQ